MMSGPGKLSRIMLGAAALALTAGCGNFGYYLQSVDGQLQVLRAREPVANVIANPATSPSLRLKLERASALRDFASRELKLPDNKSYRSYADLKRPFVVWNVFATPEFSVEPRQWCFLFAGCVGYRGYFSPERAETFANALRAEGLDVFVAGVPAYSTLGWFDDPLLNTFIEYPEYELARLIFHELAHQIAYAKGDSEFNESFAATVEAAGVARWIAASGDERMLGAFAQSQERRAQFSTLVLEFRKRLAALYKERIASDEMRARKARAFDELQRDYAALKSKWGGYAGYDRFFNGVSNAHLASVSLYNARVPHFERLLARLDGDFAAFYREVQRLAALPADARAAELAAGAP
jgi:predicted aminopeptidase